MSNKKLIFIVSAPRSGSTLFLSFLCGIPNTKVLYETKLLANIYYAQTYTDGLEELANYFDSFEEEIVIEKTPEHALYLEDIDKLRSLCKRDIYVIYIVRPPVPTILSLVKASEIWRQEEGQPPYEGLLGLCEKYEESLISIYNNLILKSNEPNVQIVNTPIYSKDVLDNIVEVDSYQDTTNIPYSFCISYRELIDNPYEILKDLLETLYIKVDIQSLIDNRITNIIKVIPQIINETCHINVLKDIEEVEIERREKISKQIIEGFTDEYKEKVSYIRSYFEHLLTKETVYNLVVNQKKSIRPFYLGSTENPEVYVVVPLYNKEKYIEETLSSIANQTYKRLRVVIIDDASTDNSVEVAKKFIDTLDSEVGERFSLLEYSTNKGVSFIRNKGLYICTDIVSFCDADDIWEPTLVEKSVNTFIKYPYVDCVYSRVSILKDKKITKLHSKICNGNIFLDAINSNILNCGSNLFVKASFLDEKYIRFDESITNVEDWEFLLRLALEGAIFKCTKEYLVTYRQTPESVTKDRFKQLNCSKKVLYKYIFDIPNSIGSSKRREMFRSSFTRRFCFYFSPKNITWDNVKDLDFSYILKVVVSKLKSFVKLYLL